ncbi:MAG: ferritin-like domain-containing protein [Alphaproteobacteria bacterium]
MEDVLVSQAGRAARLWQGDAGGPVRAGSEAHKRLFCRMLLETHDPYRPAVMEWPKLDHDTQQRLVALPIWNIAVQTEGKAKIRVASYASLIADPLLKEAVELNGFEEGRHKEVLSHLVAAYGITLAAEPPYLRPRDAEWAFLVTGYSECVDSFFAFGLFELAKRSGFFPAELVDTFEPVMQEECRHILFFVNWAAWHRKNLPWWMKPVFDARRAAVFVRLIHERLATANDMGGDNFTMTGHESLGIDIDVAGLMDMCLVENERRMSGYDARLLRPKLVPRLARLALRFMRRRKVAAKKAT